MSIHPTAIIAAGAEIASDVKIGPFCIIGPNVVIQSGTELYNNVVVDGHTTIGRNNKIYPFATIGLPPQDLSYKGEPTKTIIGDDNLIREYVSIHRATMKEEQKTIIGNRCYFMAYVHIAHDCVIGDKVILVNTVNLAGHVHIGNNVTIGGGTGVAQFVHIGRGAYLGGSSAIHKDIPAFCTGYGNRIVLKGTNIVGMRRQGYSRQVISEVVEFFRSIESSSYSPAAFIESKELMADFENNEVIQEMVADIKKSTVGIAPFAQ